MSEHFGVVRGLSSEDACARHGLLSIGGSLPAETIWSPDPWDQSVCLAAARQDEAREDWIIRFSWRPPAAVLPSPGVPPTPSPILEEADS
jgi:hypothetical protein